MCLVLVQVAVVDLNQGVGVDCQAQLDATYGEGNCTFIQCDITDGDKLKGIGLNDSMPICIRLGAFGRCSEVPL